MEQHEKINYLEFPTKDLAASKAFFIAIFDWTFVDYGPDYASFSKKEAGINGGFFKTDLSVSTKNGSVLVVFYSENLKETQLKIEKAGGQISQEIFSFPGGRRFHFSDPSGNEFAVWGV